MGRMTLLLLGLLIISAVATVTIEEPVLAVADGRCGWGANGTACDQKAASLLQRASQRAPLVAGALPAAAAAPAPPASLEQQAAGGLRRRHSAAQPGSEEEKAEFLMKASFGPSRASLAAMGSMTYAEWLQDQMGLEPTLHRAFYRARVNPRAGGANVSALPRKACDGGSRWLNFALSRRDEGSAIEVSNGVITVGGTFRTDLGAPTFAGNGLDSTSGQPWVDLGTFSGVICRVYEDVSGNVQLRASSCSSGSNIIVPNPALWIVSPSLATDLDPSVTAAAGSFAFAAGPKAGVQVLAAAATLPSAACAALTATPFVRIAAKFYMHDPRLELLENTLTSPSSSFTDSAYLVFSPEGTKHCRPEAQDIVGEEGCQAAAASLGLAYEANVYWSGQPPKCITDGSGVWYNRHWRGAESAEYQLVCLRPCPVAPRTFVNEAGCRVTSACGGSKAMVCGSPGEVGSDPSLGHRLSFYYLDDHGRNERDLKRDPEYAYDWSGGRDRHVVWSMVALKADDQLRQRVAWALSQIFVTSVRGFGFENHIEMWLNYYDIFVRHAFGSFRDIVKEVTYSPIMAQYLTYWASRAFDSDGRYPDENYARELMQLFTIGQWKLNMDGSFETTPAGERVLTYDNDDILSLAKIFTGFEQQADRGNIERMGTGRNYIDPMRIVAEWHDVYPKPDLVDNYIGDRYPLCRDLPARPFLLQGAKFEFIGFSYDGGDAFEVEVGSALHTALSMPSIRKELTQTINCEGAQCDVDTVRIVKVGEAFYEFVKPTCVNLFFFNAKVVEESSWRFGSPRYAKCANPNMRMASTACCTAQGSFVSRGYANDEYVAFSTAAARCKLLNMHVCNNSGPSAAATGDDDGLIDVWTGRDCGMSVAVDGRGNIASQADTRTRANWFMGAWQNGAHPTPDACPTECQGIRVPATAGTVIAPFVVVDDHVELPEGTTGSLGGINFTIECTSPTFVAFEAYVLAPDSSSDSFKLEIGGQSVDWHTGTSSSWRWSDASPGFDVPAGVHSVFLPGREDGIKIQSLQVVRGSESCRITETWTPGESSCVCGVEVEERAVFDRIPTPEEIEGHLFIGALQPDGTMNTQTSGGVTAYYDSELLCTGTIFEYGGRFFKNMESLIHVGNSYAFRNPPAFMNAEEPTERAVNAEVDALIDHLVEHQNTPVHVAYRLIQRFTTSNPSPDYIQAVAEAFATGSYAGTVYSGQRGDLTATVMALLLYPEEHPPSLLQEVSAPARSSGKPPSKAKSPERPRQDLRQLRAVAQQGPSCANSVRNPVEANRSYSSVWGNQAVGTGHARSMLHSAQAWSAASSSGSWMQINLGVAELVSGVVIQGRTGTWAQWVEKFTVSTSTDGGATWVDLPGVFNGSSDQDSLNEVLFDAPVMALNVRIYPTQWHSTVSMRAGLLVCAEAACGDWDVRMTNIQDGATGTPEVYYQGDWYPLCGYSYYWGDTETRQFCMTLGATGGTYVKPRWVYDKDAVEARDWQTIYQDGFTDYCRAGNAISMEITCDGGLARESTCPSPPTPAPTPYPAGVMHFEVQSAGCDFPNCGLSAFYLNGDDLEGTNSRGFNVVTLSTMGTVLSRSTWDMHYRDDARAFLDLLHKIEYGTIILIGAKDRSHIIPSPGTDAFAQFIKTRVHEALADLGASQFYGLDGHMPYALMVQKGFPGTVFEAVLEKDDTRLLKLEGSFPMGPMPTPPSPATGAGACKNWDVRLTDVIGSRGTPEVFLSGKWRPVCRHYFNDASATELCTLLGAGTGEVERVESTYDRDAVEIRTWGEIYREGLTDWCSQGTFVSAWVQCFGNLTVQSTCAPAAPQECVYQPIANADCPCEHGNHGSCDLAECGLGISPTELCEADQPLPDGRTDDWEVDNCAEHFDMYQYVCSPESPTPAPTPFPAGGLHFEVKSAAYNAGFGGWSKFYLDNVDLSGTSNRGMNVVILSAAGQVLKTSSFDLGDWNQANDEAQTLAFKYEIGNVTDGSIVLLSVKDNPYTWHDESIVQEVLESLGAKGGLYYRTPYALIAKKGAAGGPPFESLGNYRDHEELVLEGWLSTTEAPTAAPTQPPAPTPGPTSAPTAPLTAEQKRFGKLREPVVKLMHFLRAMEYAEGDEHRDVLFDNLEHRIGQWMYQSPSVFNFYKPESGPSSFNGTAVAPEFEIFTPPYAVTFYNGMIQMINTGLNSCNGGLGETQFSCSESHGNFTYSGHGVAEDVLKELDLLLTGGRLGSSGVAEVVRTAYMEAPEGEKLKAAQQAILFSSEFNTLGDTYPQGTRPAEVEESEGDVTLKPYKAVVKIFFHGGMDSFNMLVPKDCYLMDEYTDVRQDIALDPAELLDIDVPTGQGPCTKFGIHPALDVLKELYDAKEAAFVANVGGLVEPLTKEQFQRGEGKRCLGLFSHSDQILGAQTLDCESGNVASRGAGGRLGDSLAASSDLYRTSSFSVSGAAPWSQGFDTHTEILDQSTGSVRLREYASLKSLIGNITQIRHGNIYSEEYVKQLGGAIEDSEQLGDYLESMTLDATWDTRYSLSRQLQQVAKVIKSRDVRKSERDIMFTAIGGFDHHNEVIDALAGRFTEINSAVRSFVQELKLMGVFDQVTILTASDFGRTLTSNGAGSDHGWGGIMFVAGGGIDGGNIFNEYPQHIYEGNDHDAGRGRMIPTKPWEFMELPVAQWMGLQAADYDYVYPNYANFNASEHFIPVTRLYK